MFKLVTLFILMAFTVSGCFYDLSRTDLSAEQVDPTKFENEYFFEIKTIEIPNLDEFFDKPGAISSWWMFDDPKYGRFKFSYPQSWKMEEYSYPDEKAAKFILSNREINGYVTEGIVKIYFYTYDTELSLYDWFIKNDKYNSESIKNIINFIRAEKGEEYIKDYDVVVENYKFNSDSSVIVQYVKFDKPESLEGLAQTKKLYYKKVGDKIYLFIGETPTDKQTEEFLKRIDEVFSTIKFY